jgi:TolB-like protein/Flp pilus assembly protein TadD|tara:strand:+ start:128 stop:2452 length:2325 start_codon:yes stop_codon:yes gene_type:complete
MERPFPAYQGEQPYIFVSYAHADAAIVYPEIRRLQEAGLNVWWDEGISPGQRWSDQLAVHVSHAALFLYFITPRSVESDVCLDEAYLRLEQSKPLLAVHLEQTALPEGLGLRLGSRQAILKHELTEPAYRDKLIMGVQDHLQPGPPGVSITPAPPGKGARTRPMLIGIWLLVFVTVVSALMLRLGPWSDESEVQKVAESPAAQAATGEPPSGTATQKKRASIAVLPFDNISGDPDQVYFVDGMTDAIITRLAMNRGLHVIARNSTFIYKGQAVDVQQVGEALGVAYVLEGGVQKAGDTIRITAQLIEAHTETHVWTDTYDRQLKDPFALQDDIAGRVATALITAQIREEMSKARRVPTESRTAYDAYLRGRYYQDQWARKGNAALNTKAREHFERAIALDPEFANAHAWLGWTYWTGAFFDTNSVPDALIMAQQLAEAALSRDADCTWAHTTLAYVFLAQGGHAQALKAAEKVRDLMPSSPLGHHVKGAVLYMTGRYRESASLFETVLALNPAEPTAWPFIHLGDDLRQLGEFDRAESVYRECSARYPQHPACYLGLAYNYLERWATQQEANPDALDQAYELARKSVDLDNNSDIGHLALAGTYLIRRRYDRALGEVDRMSDIGVSAAFAPGFRARILNAMGSPDLALAAVEPVIQRDPPEAGATVTLNVLQRVLALTSLSHAYRLTGRSGQAMAALELALTLPLGVANSFRVHVELAILNSEMGNEEQAQAAASEILKLSPNFSVEVWGQRNPHREQAQIQRDMAALNEAGLN